MSNTTKQDLINFLYTYTLHVFTSVEWAPNARQVTKITSAAALNCDRQKGRRGGGAPQVCSF